MTESDTHAFRYVDTATKGTHRVTVLDARKPGREDDTFTKLIADEANSQEADMGDTISEYPIKTTGLIEACRCGLLNLVRSGTLTVETAREAVREQVKAWSNCKMKQLEWPGKDHMVHLRKIDAERTSVTLTVIKDGDTWQKTIEVPASIATLKDSWEKYNDFCDICGEGDPDDTGKFSMLRQWNVEGVGRILWDVQHTRQSSGLTTADDNFVFEEHDSEQITLKLFQEMEALKKQMLALGV